MPLFETYKHYHPFKGAVLAGVFTQGSLIQLRSLGFRVAYFPYETVLNAFAAVGIDASSDETTPDKEFAKKLARWKALTRSAKAKISEELARINSGEIESFIEVLRDVTMRTVKTVRIIALHGNMVEYPSIQDAIGFIQVYNEDAAAAPLVRFEVLVLYMNGDQVSGEFATKEAAIKFLTDFSADPASAR